MAENQSPANSQFGLYVRLSLMMFLEFAVWGAWSIMIAPHMASLGFSGFRIGLVFGTTAVGSILAPMIAGSLADRYMPSQNYTGIAHLLGAVLLVVAYRQTEFLPLYLVMCAYAMTYMPTIALTNGIAFHHMGQSEKFGAIRVWGTLGWIFISFVGAAILKYWDSLTPGVSHAGATLLLAAVCAVLMGLYSFTLPNTPPSKDAKNPYAFLEAFQLTANRNFAVLLVISFIVAIELPFYYNLTPLFFGEKAGGALGLGGLGLAEHQIPTAMVIGQIGESLVMLALWPMIRAGGMRWTIFLGILAWPLRYTIFAIGQPAGLVVASQVLHGVCYSFFFVGGMIAAERLAPKDIRASAQSLMLFATNGCGMLVGHFVSGLIHDHYKVGDVHRWSMIWLVPIVLTIVAAVCFILLWDETRFQRDAAGVHDEEQRAETPV